MKTSFLILVFAGVAIAADTLKPRLSQLSANHHKFAQNQPEIIKHNLAEAVVAEIAPAKGLNLAQLQALDAQATDAAVTAPAGAPAGGPEVAPAGAAPAGGAPKTGPKSTCSSISSDWGEGLCKLPSLSGCGCQGDPISCNDLGTCQLTAY